MVDRIMNNMADSEPKSMSFLAAAPEETTYDSRSILSGLAFVAFVPGVACAIVGYANNTAHTRNCIATTAMTAMTGRMLQNQQLWMGLGRRASAIKEPRTGGVAQDSNSSSSATAIYAACVLANERNASLMGSISNNNVRMQVSWVILVFRTPNDLFPAFCRYCMRHRLKLYSFAA
jgi:hypothetical protein